MGLVAFAVVIAFVPSAVAQPCVVPDNGDGTVNLPPDGCPYLSPDEFHVIVDGLPAGTTITIDPIHAQFFNIIRNETPDGGEIELFDSNLTLQMTGSGPPLDGFKRFINVQMAAQISTSSVGWGLPLVRYTGRGLRA